MDVIGLDVLAKAMKQHPDAKKWLNAWIATARKFDWRSIADVRETFPTADGVKLKSGVVVTIFNVKGNSYRLLTWIKYEYGIVEALDVLTHAEYDKMNWKVRY